MYGSISHDSSHSNKATGLAAVCGFAAVVAVAGLVGFNTQPASLYAATAVRPATGVVSAPVVALRDVVRAPAVAAYPVGSEQVQQPVMMVTSAPAQSITTFAPLAMGLTALAAVAAIVMGKSKAQSAMAPQPLAMAATSGERLVWLPGAQPPAHLTGQYPGDRGFDPLGLSKDPKAYERMRISEVFHGRLAMLGVVGCLAPELLFHQVSWFDAPAALDLKRVGLAALQVIAPLEYWRGNGGFNWDGTDGSDRNYPGFDPLGITTEDTKLREIKNGRLAMLAMAGFEVQYHTTGKSPLANLAEHLSDPLHNNVFIHAGSSVAMFAAAGKKERPLWFPGAHSPAWLTGEYPGDRGFDVFGLAADPTVYARMRLSEVFHGRLAMLAVVGALVPEYLGNGAWFQVPDSIGMGVPQVGTAVLLSGFPEVFRGQGGFSKDTMDKSYPGFDPLKLTTDYTKEAEIKNGRLAMTAMLGFEFQYRLTGKSPLVNFLDHIHHPLNNNIADTLIHRGSVAMFAASGHKDGVWFPGAKPAAHLTGEYPADRGFDPLSLAADPTVYARMRLSEVFHGRLAMLGVVGCIVPELLGKGAWFQAGDVVDGTKLGFIAMCIAAPTEYWRGNGGFGWDKGTFDRSYPGFDPLKLTTDRTKVAEIKNGRLAMAAILGFAAQYNSTGDSPLANVATHIANPLGANILSKVAGDLATSGIAMF